MGGGTQDSVILHVGGGPGIIVTPDAVQVEPAYVTSQLADDFVDEDGDTMTGALVIDYPVNDTANIRLYPNYGAFQGYNSAGELVAELRRDQYSQYGRLDLYSQTAGYEGKKTALYGSFYGELNLFDGDGTETVTLYASNTGGADLFLNQQDGTSGAKLYGGSTSDGARLQLYSHGGVNTVKLDADLSGDGAAILPDSSISAEEIGDEPGIAADYWHGTTTLTQTGMTDMETITITTPCDGYIVIHGSCTVTCRGTTDYNRGYVQIDETAGGLNDMFWNTLYGFDSPANNDDMHLPVHTMRWYYKPAGTYEFRMEGMQRQDNSATASQWSIGHTLVAMFIPTSYGSVAIPVAASEAGQFQNPVLQESTGATPDGSGTTEPMYRVDLRELELKAARLRAETERAERELLEAQMARMEAERRENAGMPENSRDQ